MNIGLIRTIHDINSKHGSPYKTLLFYMLLYLVIIPIKQY